MFPCGRRNKRKAGRARGFFQYTVPQAQAPKILLHPIRCSIIAPVEQTLRDGQSGRVRTQSPSARTRNIAEPFARTLFPPGHSGRNVRKLWRAEETSATAPWKRSSGQNSRPPPASTRATLLHADEPS